MRSAHVRVLSQPFTRLPHANIAAAQVDHQQQTSQQTAAAAARGGRGEEQEAHQWLVKQDIVKLIPLVLFRCFDQVQHTKVVEVPELFTICDGEVTFGLAGFVDDLIDKFRRVFKRQLPHLVQNTFAQRRLLLHEVDVVVDPSHDKLIPNLDGLQDC